MADTLKPCPFTWESASWETVDKNLAQIEDQGREIVAVCPLGGSDYVRIIHRSRAPRPADPVTVLLVEALKPFEATAKKANAYRHEPGSTCTWVIKYDDLAKAAAAIAAYRASVLAAYDAQEAANG